LQVENVTMSYDGQKVLDHINLSVETGQRIAVIGPNGAGKTTLFRVIVGLLKPEKGRVLIFGSEPRGHICISYVPQRSQVDWQFPATVSDVVMMGRAGKIGLVRRPGKTDREVVEQSLEIVKMAGMSKRQISELSGGQQQRVFIARALAQEAELMLMDEPMTGLDPKSQEDILAILDKLAEKKVTSLISLHDMKMARENFNTVLLINKSIRGFGAPESVFSSQALAEAYASHLHFVADEGGQIAVSDMCCKHGDDNG
jgi:manganese/iron transport system ATP-binding protein